MDQPKNKILPKDGIDRHLVKGREEQRLNVRKPLLKLVEGSKGSPGAARGAAGGKHGGQPLNQNCQPLAWIVSPDGREARRSAGTAVQPAIEFVQFSGSVILRIFQCGVQSSVS